MRWNFVSDTIFFSIRVKRKEHITLEGFLLGFGNVLLEGPPFAHVRPEGCLPGPRKTGEKEAFVALLRGFLKLRSTFASLGSRALEKGLIELHEEPQESPGGKGLRLRLPTPFP